MTKLMCMFLIFTANCVFLFAQQGNTEKKERIEVTSVGGAVILYEDLNAPIKILGSPEIFSTAKGQFIVDYSLINVSDKPISKISIGFIKPIISGTDGFHQSYEFPDDQDLLPGMSFSSIECCYELNESSLVEYIHSDSKQSKLSYRPVIVAIIESVEFRDGTTYSRREVSLSIEDFILEFLEECKSNSDCRDLEEQLLDFSTVDN